MCKTDMPLHEFQSDKESIKYFWYVMQRRSEICSIKSIPWRLKHVRMWRDDILCVCWPGDLPMVE